MDRLVPVISSLQVCCALLPSGHNSSLFRQLGNLIANDRCGTSIKEITLPPSIHLGKSSLLESIIGRQFLPKGKGIVTRRPAEIQLCLTSGEREYAELVERKETFENMDELRKAIEVETEKVCGPNKNVSNTPIRIRFYSKRVLNLLLVDLPGIIKNPIGDQPKDIEDQITKMIKLYIRNPNCIIVAVSKATEDSANSESLKLARQFDRNGSRTISVITHVDQTDPSVNAIKQYGSLTGNSITEHIGVCLRPSKAECSIEDQFERQRQYFRSHDHYKQFAEQMGVPALIRLMNLSLIKHIKVELPVIREQIIYLLQKKKTKIAEYGLYEVSHDKKGQGALILNLISRYVKHISELIEGRSTDTRQQVIGGARIEFIFSQIFIKSIKKMNPFEYLTDNDIRTAIRNANGLRKSLFLPEAAFENLLRTQIARLRQPSLQCAQLIHEQLRRVIYNIRIPEIDKYEILSQRIFEVMESLLAKSLGKTQDMIKNLIEIEIGYINTNHPDFVDVIALISEQAEQHDSSRQRSMDNSQIGFESELDQFTVQPQSIQDHRPQETSLFKFNVKKQERVEQDHPELLDAKISQIGASQRSQPRSRDPLVKYQSKVVELDSFEASIWQRTQPRPYKLPCVPSSILINDKPKLRQQTETEMIKKLIASYFNVVKKNINDSVPKSIVTFLVNHCKNACEKILVNQIYVEIDYAQLLKQRQYVTSERERLQKDIQCLSECLDAVNQIESEMLL